MTLARPAPPVRLRARPWQADRRVAHVAPALDFLGPLTPADIERAVHALRDEGYRSVITAALHQDDRAPFLAVGFVETARLHLLRHTLDHIGPMPAMPGIDLRRGRRREHVAALDVDRDAFAPFWRLDAAGLDEALSATTAAHFQVARDRSGVIGYAVCGRAGHRGYVQRLAVAPDRQGRGVGAALLDDGLRWLRRWGARDALVNTQVGNERSLRLYERAGFVREPEGLAVLELALVDTPGDPTAHAFPPTTGTNGA